MFTKKYNSASGHCQEVSRTFSKRASPIYIYITRSMRSALVYIALIGAIFIYTTSGVFSKLASQQDFASLLYLAFLCGSVAVLGIYAVLWQQIIKRMPVGDAYLFKGSGVIFGLALAFITPPLMNAPLPFGNNPFLVDINGTNNSSKFFILGDFYAV